MRSSGMSEKPLLTTLKLFFTSGEKLRGLKYKLWHWSWAGRGRYNWEPPFQEGEGELSVKRHKEWLQNEYMRRAPGTKKLKYRMALTFPGKRKLMNKKVPLAEVRAEYPALFNCRACDGWLHDFGVLLFCKVWLGYFLIYLGAITFVTFPRRNFFILHYSFNVVGKLHLWY